VIVCIDRPYSQTVPADGLMLALARYQLGLETADSLRGFGVDLLAAGSDEALELAIADDLDVAEIGPILERLGRELGHPLPTLDAAINLVTAAILGEVANGVTEPEAGLEQLMRDVVQPHVREADESRFTSVGEAFGLQHLIGAYYGYDDLRSRPDELSVDGKFGREAIALHDQHVIAYARDWLRTH
jgi:hypothetical protein